MNLNSSRNFYAKIEEGESPEKGVKMVILIISLIFITIPLFLTVKHRNNQASLFLLLMILSYLLVMGAFLTYLAKDNCYYNSLYKYLGISQEFHNYLIFFPISVPIIIRTLNLFSALFIYCSLCFSLFFSLAMDSKRSRTILLFLAISPVFQVIIYDPLIYQYLYYQLYPDLLSASYITDLYQIIHKITFTANYCYLVAGIGLMSYAALNSPSILKIRSYILLVMISFITIIMTYFYLNYRMPDLLIRVSKVANYVSYVPLDLENNPIFYRFLPILTILCFIINSFGVYKYAHIRNKIKNQDWEISRNIDSAALVTRVFSHYLKNELVAIKSQIEELKSIAENNSALAEGLTNIDNRCRSIYDRLDNVHRNTIKTKINLKPVSLFEIIQDTLSEMQPQLDGIQVNTAMAPPEPIVLMDDYYFSQALQNIIINAIEAMERIPVKKRVLNISVSIRNQWVELSIQDYGIGIPETDLDKIFQPFFSSKPITKNWGMGLSLCHSIINAHGGRISVESKVNDGTTFHLVLPLIRIRSN